MGLVGQRTVFIFLADQLLDFGLDPPGGDILTARR